MVQEHFVTLRGLKFHYREWSRRGTPLILLHGLASQTHIFDLVAPLLAQPQNGHQKFRVIALDQRGHGESAKPEKNFDFENVARDVRALLDALNLKRAIIAGHSWGGNVALYFAARFPERTRAIILIDGGFLDIQANPDMTWERTARELAPPNLTGTPVAHFKQLIKQYAGKMWTVEIEKIVLQNFEIQSDNTIRPRLSYERHMQILRALWEMRPRELYPQLKCPVLLLPADMPDEDNRAWRAQRRAEIDHARREIPNNQLVWFRNTVHDIPLHRPRKLANTITKFARTNKLIRP